MRVRTWVRGFVGAALLAAMAGLAPAADHSTAFLDPLEAAIGARVAEIGTPATPALRKELNFLRAAGRALDHDTAKLSADLAVLAKALVHLRKIQTTVPAIPMSVESAVSSLRWEVDALASTVSGDVEDLLDAGLLPKKVQRAVEAKMRTAERAYLDSLHAPNHQKAALQLTTSARLLEQVQVAIQRYLPT